ncbi:hypothetical protein [Pendulispora albinea]|uniref:Uncharacterized protein n=1 Tax=Pendulispora albinea TaxID=2741071 RepID=A0ABZ2LXH7_9BACT
MKEPKPLDEHLSRLVRAERDAQDLPLGAEARAWARLERATTRGGGRGGEPLAPSENVRPSGAWVRRSRPSRAWIATSLLAVFGLGVAAGVLGSRIFDQAGKERERVVYVERVASAPSSPAAPFDAPSPSDQPGSPEVTFEIPFDGKASGAPSALPASRQLAEERALLDVARAALNRTEGEEALRATERHKARFPSGMLGEEREALAIQALLVLVRNEEASRRAARFEQRYPRSVLLPTVRAAIEGSR